MLRMDVRYKEICPSSLPVGQYFLSDSGSSNSQVCKKLCNTTVADTIRSQTSTLAYIGFLKTLTKDAKCTFYCSSGSANSVIKNVFLFS